MGVALGHLRWSPDAFWRATPRELCAALRGPGHFIEPVRAEHLAALMRAFPDGDFA